MEKEMNKYFVFIFLFILVVVLWSICICCIFSNHLDAAGLIGIVATVVTIAMVCYAYNKS